MYLQVAIAIPCLRHVLTMLEYHNLDSVTGRICDQLAPPPPDGTPFVVQKLESVPTVPGTGVKFKGSSLPHQLT